MKITIRLEDEYGKGVTEVTRELSWTEDAESVEVHTMAGDQVVRFDLAAQHEKKVVTQVAALAVDIHHTR